MLIEVLAIAVLATLSLYDLKTRELPERLVYSSIILLLVAQLLRYTGIGYSRLLAFYVGFDSLVLIMVSIIAWMGLIGWGDVAALAIIAIASPTPSHNIRIMPPVLLTLLYYVVIVGLVMAATAIYNIAFHRAELSKLPPRYRLVYMLIARPVKAVEIVEKPGWWYPLNLCGRYTTSFNIYLDPPDIAKQVKQAIAKGCIKKDSIIWVSYGLPGLPIITVAYILTLILGEAPFTIA